MTKAEFIATVKLLGYKPALMPMPTRGARNPSFHPTKYITPNSKTELYISLDEVTLQLRSPNKRKGKGKGKKDKPIKRFTFDQMLATLINMK